jgi:branched-chain amino acid transport system ATP-binding protein
MPEAALLEVKELCAGYGGSRVLHDVCFSVNAGEVVTLIGRNGAGKTTTLRAIMGLLDDIRGSVRIGGIEYAGAAPERIAAAGVGYCPEERGIYGSLTVEENLKLPRRVAPGGMELAEIYARFPQLSERRHSQGNKLSGGEQQMLAIARILRTGAGLLLLDEPTEGLAPVIVKQIGALLDAMKERGLTIVLVEQNVVFAARVADRHVVLENGVVVDVIPAQEFAARGPDIARYLGV